MRDFHVVLRMLPAFVDVRDQMLIHGFSSLLRTGLNLMKALRHFPSVLGQLRARVSFGDH